ncbi:SICA antigen [Plasmodium coatneyi]|uniref:SICA antigen n=1 Tax=Plasmodium coatneyi TaxID=208452 RepID=A0A1B1DTK4_9APIC|nr:SICA antigen [Plasmodium coatneyi]ANQ06092.1 SICA antigen [Plasmodium coatneyi]
MDQNCTSFSGTNKEACKLITAGLKHIYSTQVDEKNSDQVQAQHNRPFYQTMSCAALNVYADMLIKETGGQPCAITEVAIGKMFNEGNKQISTWCKDKTGSSLQCVTCERKPNLNCEIEYNNIKYNVTKKVGNLLQEDSNIQPTLTTINDMCKKSQAPKEKTENSDTQKSGKEDVTCGEAATYRGNSGGVLIEVSGAAAQQEHCEGYQPHVPKANEEDDGAGDSSSALQHPDDDENTKSSPPKVDADTEKKASATDEDDVDSNNNGEQGASPVDVVVGGGSSVEPSGSEIVAPGEEPPSGAGGEPDSSTQGISPTSSLPAAGKTSHSPGTRTNNGNGRKEGMDNPSELLTPYLPTIPVFIGLSVTSYLLWKYLALPGKRKRYRRAPQIRGPLPLEQQIVDEVDDQADGTHEYTLVKERKPRSTPIKRRKKRGVDRRAVGRRRGVRRRMIIDIHLEVLAECQKGDLHSTKGDYFTILVQEFMGSEFIKEENVPKEQVESSDFGFREEDFLPKEQVHISDSTFREEDFIPREDVPKEEIPKFDVPKGQVPCSDSGFRVNVPKEQVPSSGFRF